MTTGKDGGPAFPCEYSLPENQGVTLRDYFAAKAMQGLMGRVWGDPSTGVTPANVIDLWAATAYDVADAMLKARST